QGLRIAGAVEKGVKVWNARTRATEISLIGHVGAVLSIAWSSDGALIATAGLDGTARIWDSDTGDLLDVIAQGRQVWSVGFSPYGQQVLATADDGSAAIYDLPRFDAIALPEVMRYRVPFAFESDRLASRVPDPSGCQRTSSAP